MPARLDLLIWGARIRTLVPDLPMCGVAAVKDGHVLATGDDDTIRAMRGPTALTIDGCGIAFVPGFTNSDFHRLPFIMTMVDGRMTYEARERS